MDSLKFLGLTLLRVLFLGNCPPPNSILLHPIYGLLLMDDGTEDQLRKPQLLGIFPFWSPVSWVLSDGKTVKNISVIFLPSFSLFLSNLSKSNDLYL